MNYYFLILYWLFPVFVLAQTNDSLQKISKPVMQTVKESNTSQYKPEIFTSGFIDILNSGQVNASSRFIRLFIGEPGKFAVPLSLYSGVSSNNFQNAQTTLQRNNNVLVTNFINPMSGLANISIDGVLFFNRKKEKLQKPGCCIILVNVY